VTRYLLTDEAKQDLVGIKRYLTDEAGARVAKATLARIKDAIVFLGRTPGAGHVREDLTDVALKFWSVNSYLIIYDPATRPIQVIRVLHGSRDVSTILADDGW
jgi:plasmid stabilization system protein ParE